MVPSIAIISLTGLHISKTRCPNFSTFSAHVAPGRGSVFLWRRRDMLCTSGFVDDAMYTYNGRQATRMGHIVEVTNQRAASRAKSAVFDCLVVEINSGWSNEWSVNCRWYFYTVVIVFFFQNHRYLLSVVASFCVGSQNIPTYMGG